VGRDKSSQGISSVKLDPFELIIYRLSPILGGRSEVLETPVLEALSYLDMEKQERENKKLETFQLLLFGANSRIDPKARKKYYDKIKPKQPGGRLLNNPSKALEWDYSKMDEFRAKPKQ
jgi:hypothetical protein